MLDDIVVEVSASSFPQPPPVLDDSRRTMAYQPATKAVQRSPMDNLDGRDSNLFAEQSSDRRGRDDYGLVSNYRDISCLNMAMPAPLWCQ